jgi:hypothetical protein
LFDPTKKPVYDVTQGVFLHQDTTVTPVTPVYNPVITTDDIDDTNPSSLVSVQTDENNPLAQNQPLKYPSLSLALQDRSIQANATATININAQNVEKCWGYGGDGTDFVSDWLSPSQKIVKVSPSKSSCYVDECWNKQGQSTGAKTIVISVPETPIPTCQINYRPTLTFTATTSKLMWITKDVDACWLYGGGIIPGWTDSVNTSISVNPKTSTSYFMKCWSPSGKETGGWQKATILVEGTPLSTVTPIQKPVIEVSISDNSEKIQWDATPYGKFCAINKNGSLLKKEAGAKNSLSIEANTAKNYIVECWNERGESSGAVGF